MRHLAIEGTDVWRKILDMDNHFFGYSVDNFKKLFSECHVESPNYLQESTSGLFGANVSPWHGHLQLWRWSPHPGGNGGWSRLAHNTPLEEARYFPNTERLQDF
ncbi:hypothetical protein O181_060998 [Austropuccinia psidii MF-1]|uniref:Uncharacterized protein n=1 Tax=Austropuccinia psidii MF-1 TaxID=1389203 RepID=A0A9Q3EHC2_9BASI|nr:hypothetical protein [Austropuccinia psidii MF-1]